MLNNSIYREGEIVRGGEGVEPVNAAKGANWAARLDMGMGGCICDVWCGRLMISE